MRQRKKNNKGMKGKRGVSWLSEHIMNIIIAVACIIILIAVGWKIYNLFSDQTDLQKADSNLKLIKERIDLLKNTLNADSIEVLVYPPKNWVLRSYIESFPQAECYSKQGCLCLCEDGSCANNVPKTCYGFEYKAEIPGKFEVPRSWYNPGRYVFNPTIYENAIGLSKAVEGLKIYKSNDMILIEQKK